MTLLHTIGYSVKDDSIMKFEGDDFSVLDEALKIITQILEDPEKVKSDWTDLQGKVLCPVCKKSGLEVQVKAHITACHPHDPLGIAFLNDLAAKEPKSCPKGHNLMKISVDKRHNCDMCKTKNIQVNGEFYRCMGCDYDLCSKCFDDPTKVVDKYISITAILENKQLTIEEVLDHDDCL